MDTKEDFSEEMGKKNLVAANVVILVVFLLVIGGVYYFVSNKNKGQTVFPAGINYVSPQGPTPTPMYDYEKLVQSSDWVTYKGKTFPYSFEYPKELKPVTYPNDKSDAVAFKVSALPPEQSLLLTVEKISSRDNKLVGKPEEFVNSYWKYFSGLSGLKEATTLTNEKGLKGYKAKYIIKGTKATTSDYYFFIVEGDNDILLHVGDIFPTEGKAVFNRIINSLEYKK
ncbi:MAG: hypothetical protein WCT22_03020 [Patescibacteria group bacterium]